MKLINIFCTSLLIGTLSVSCNQSTKKDVPASAKIEEPSSETPKTNEYAVLEKMGSEQGFDRKKIVQFVRAEIGIIGNDIGKVEVAANYATVELNDELNKKVEEYFSSKSDKGVSYVNVEDFEFFQASSPADDRDNRDTGTESDHYGNDGPHGSGEGHSADRVNDRCHD